MASKFSNSLDLLIGKLAGWWNSFVSHLPNIILALLVATIMIVGSRYAKRKIYKMIQRFNFKPAISRLVANISAGAVLFLAMVLVLNILNLQQTVTSLLAGAGIAGLAIGLAFQDTLANLFAGIVISTNKDYNVGDQVKTNGQEGTIVAVGLRYTHIQSFSGELVIVPNRKMASEVMENFTVTGERRVEIGCGVSYDEDLDMVVEVARKAIEDQLDYDSSKPVEVLFNEFGGSSINFSLRFWINGCSKYNALQMRHQGIVALKKAFDKAGIAIPFPIRTLDFDIKGGLGLEKILKSRPKSQNGMQPSLKKLRPAKRKENNAASEKEVRN